MSNELPEKWVKAAINHLREASTLSDRYLHIENFRLEMRPYVEVGPEQIEQLKTIYSGGENGKPVSRKWQNIYFNLDKLWVQLPEDAADIATAPSSGDIVADITMIMALLMTRKIGVLEISLDHEMELVLLAVAIVTKRAERASVLDIGLECQVLSEKHSSLASISPDELDHILEQLVGYGCIEKVGADMYRACESLEDSYDEYIESGEA